MFDRCKWIFPGFTQRDTPPCIVRPLQNAQGSFPASCSVTGKAAVLREARHSFSSCLKIPRAMPWRHAVENLLPPAFSVSWSSSAFGYRLLLRTLPAPCVTGWPTATATTPAAALAEGTGLSATTASELLRQRGRRRRVWGLRWKSLACSRCGLLKKLELMQVGAPGRADQRMSGSLSGASMARLLWTSLSPQASALAPPSPNRPTPALPRLMLTKLTSAHTCTRISTARPRASSLCRWSLKPAVGGGGRRLPPPGVCWEV